jgi:very-short-patch-repair endonuclease
MHFLEIIAEQKLAEAAKAGEFDDLPGAGKPLDLDEDAQTKALEAGGFRVLRFWNNEVLQNLDGVYSVIERALEVQQK